MKVSTDPKVMLITGAARGIGAALAERAVRKGYRVAIADIDAAGAKARATSLGENARAMRLDIRSTKSWDRAIKSTIDHFGGLDILVNNAAVVHSGRTEAVSLRAHVQTMTVNALGPMLGMLAAVPVFKRRGAGQVVTICSMTAFLPLPGIVSYCASKHALRALHFGIALENRDAPIDFTIIHPGATETRMLDDEARAGVSVAFARPAWNPEDVAAMILKAIRQKKTEVCIPPSRARVAKAIGANPRRLFDMVAVSEKAGAAALKKRARLKKRSR
ncbi:SDR family NAD(P)-dependent oxidoreductase [Dongia sedimenti]|uniref:SDR family oxidoreductase n=1 Tax=Dongia sedimenti TaxID=3064282 RepID=A0ABU0YPV1_9PROT|nr:SDR family oxidoreductase [Rhodospirillaceae bacterium R-7]